MSFSVQDRHGALDTHYAGAFGCPSTGTGHTWWPDYGPGCRDFSSHPVGHPAEKLFDKFVKPMAPAAREDAPVPSSQFRHPMASREALMGQRPLSPGTRKAMKHANEHQQAVRRLNDHSLRMDEWHGGAPLRPSQAARLREVERQRMSHSSSDPAISSVGSMSRETLERLGFCVGRSVKGSAGTFTQAPPAGAPPRGETPRRPHSLSFTSMLHGAGRSPSASKPKAAPEAGRRKPTTRSASAASKFTVAVGKDGWPEPPSFGNREHHAPVGAALPSRFSFNAPPAADCSPKARGMAAGSAGSTLTKAPYGSGTHPNEPWDSPKAPMAV